MFEIFHYAGEFFTLTNLIAIFAGAALGILIGVLPGIGGGTTAALLLPITLTLDPVTSVSFLGSMYCAANFGGSITAILINTPGDPSAATTALDGYPLARRGEAGLAIGISALASAIGGIFSVFVMIVATPVLARSAYNFGAPEYFALAVFGLSMVAAVGGDSALKNLLAGAFGVFISTIGFDSTTGEERFTFGSFDLYNGVSLTAVLIGAFAVSELLEQASLSEQDSKPLKLNKVVLPGKEDLKKSAKSIGLGSVLGTFIGILPALGPTTASLITYSETKRWSKYKHEFGKGSIEGVAGPEAANNAAVGGAMVPTLALGIPGSAMAAIILAGLIAQGVRPGPQLFLEQPNFLYAVFFSMFLANLLYLVSGFGLAKMFARLTQIPPTILWPCVFVLSVIGAYSDGQSMFNVGIMLVFGVIGFLMKRGGFSVAPLVIGLVLGGMVEYRLKQSLAIFDGDWMMFFGRPIVVLLFALTFLSICGKPILDLSKRVLFRQRERVSSS